MWLQTTRGFLSVVVADTKPGSGTPDPDTLMVRARRRAHLELLQEAHPSLAVYQIIESAVHCDYRYRLVLPKRLFAEVMLDEVMQLGYRNFKAEAQRHAQEGGADFVAALHQIWGVLRQLQE